MERSQSFLPHQESGARRRLKQRAHTPGTARLAHPTVDQLVQRNIAYFAQAYQIVQRGDCCSHLPS